MIGHVSVFAAALVAAGAAALSFPPSTTCDGHLHPTPAISQKPMSLRAYALEPTMPAERRWTIPPHRGSREAHGLKSSRVRQATPRAATTS
jgi:hypothetical protein